MAESSIAGLFQDPLLYQQAQDQAAFKRFAELAQLDPLQQAQASLMYGGYQAGGALGRALGGEDPALKMVTMRNNIGKTVDPTDPMSYIKAAQQLSQMGDIQGASILAEKGREAQYKQAQIEKTQGKFGATTQSERNRELIQSAEVKLAQGSPLDPQEEARVRWLVANETKPKVFRDSDTGEIIKIDPLDINTAAPNIAKLLGRQAAAGTTQSDAGITTSQPSKVATPIRKELADVDQQITSLDNSITTINNLIPKIETLDLGLSQNIERGVRKFLGKPTEDTQLFSKLQRQTVSEANKILMAAKGTQTEGDADRAYKQIADPDTWKNKGLLEAAFKDLADVHEKTKVELQAKRQTLTAPGVPQPPIMTTPVQVAPASTSAATPAERIAADIAGLQREIKNTKPGETGRLQILQNELQKAQKAQSELNTKKVKKWSDL